MIKVYQVWTRNGKELYGQSNDKKIADDEATRLRRYKYPNGQNFHGRVTVRLKKE